MDILNKVQEVLDLAQNYNIGNPSDLEQFRLEFLSKKGKVALLMEEIKNIALENRKAFGQEVNGLKQYAEGKFRQFQEQFESQIQTPDDIPDLTLPTIPYSLGSIHPLTIIKNRIIEIFERMGFNQSEGPEIEDDFHNFTGLNFPENHPARDMQDTFFIEADIALRTHTSSVQIRVMESQQPPLRTFSIGRVFRNEAISARAHCIFHQIEGFFIDENVSFADLKQTLYHFAREMFGKDTRIRLRPSYFPFTEPSAELDISCDIDNPKGCQLCGGSKNICKGTGWVEIGGCGMIDPQVFINCGLDPQIYTGFAFGMGLERITMLKFRIRDIRLFTENDLRFLRQFEGLE